MCSTDDGVGSSHCLSIQNCSWTSYIFGALCQALLFSFFLQNLEGCNYKIIEHLTTFGCNKTCLVDDNWRNGGIRVLSTITASCGEQSNWACLSWTPGSDLKPVVPACSHMCMQFLCKRGKDFLVSIASKIFTFVNFIVFRKRIWSSALNKTKSYTRGNL